MKIADLHIHTTASDGVYSPAEIVGQAIRLGLSTIAITDHDTVGGIASLGNLSDSRIRVIAGIEFSSNCLGEEIHILGYLPDVTHPRLLEMVEHIKVLRRERLLKMLQRLRDKGYPVTLDDLQRATGSALSWGRPHLAKILIEKGYFTTVSEVFDELLSSRGSIFIPRTKPLYTEVIDLMKEIGGISVLAHPGIIKNPKCIEAAIEAGIDGIEVYHPKNHIACREHLLAIAKKHSCLITGGSDFHGMKGRYPEQLGCWTVDASYGDALIERLSRSHR